MNRFRGNKTKRCLICMERPSNSFVPVCFPVAFVKRANVGLTFARYDVAIDRENRYEGEKGKRRIRDSSPPPLSFLFFEISFFVSIKGRVSFEKNNEEQFPFFRSGNNSQFVSCRE